MDWGNDMRLVILFSALLLVACARKQPPPPEPQMSAAEMHAMWDAAAHRRCVSYGLEKGTATYANCRVQMENMYQRKREAQRAALIQFGMIHLMK
jgi:hypothetical protein